MINYMPKLQYHQPHEMNKPGKIWNSNHNRKCQSACEAQRKTTRENGANGDIIILINEGSAWNHRGEQGHQSKPGKMETNEDEVHFTMPNAPDQ